MPDPGGQKPVALDQSLAGHRMGPPAARGHHCPLQAEAGCGTGGPFLAAPITEAHAQQSKTGAGVASILWWSGEKVLARVRENVSPRPENCLLVDGKKDILSRSGENPMVVGGKPYGGGGKNPIAVGGNFTLKWR